MPEERREYDKLILQMLRDIKDDVKGIRQHNEQMEDHFDIKLGHCENAMLDHLKDRYYTKDEFRDKVTLAIEASEKRTVARVKLVGWVIAFVLTSIGGVMAFMSKYGSVILAILSTKKDG